jgi:cell wall-associated NlpC family hydrolase
MEKPGTQMLNMLLRTMGRALANYLSQPSAAYRPVAVADPAQLKAALRPGDVLLVEGELRISTVIKYLTQSRWSHAALYVGDALAGPHSGEDPPVLVEADLLKGVQAVPLSKYASFHVRVCRPVGISREDLQRVIASVVSRIGQGYDLKNVIDLARYMVPIPVPGRLRRTVLELGSGEPSKAICSTLIVQAFQAVRYPILPRVTRLTAPEPSCADWVKEILHNRHHSLYAPCDFDLSPYFQVVKPSVEAGFDYKALTWADEPEAGTGPLPAESWEAPAPVPGFARAAA